MSKNRFPGAMWSPLPESGTHGKHEKTQLIFHSTGTRASAAQNRNYFAQTGVKVESTLIVDYDGRALQVMEAHEQADANTSASKRAISVEVVGLGTEAFTPDQLAKCIDIARWATTHHPIEPRQIPSHEESGIGWHVMFGAPGPWTTVRGKVCPGDKRIEQIKDFVIPAVRPFKASLIAATVPPVPQESDMQSGYLFNDGKKTYLREGGDTIHLPDLADIAKYEALGYRNAGKFSDELTARLVEAAKQ